MKRFVFIAFLLLFAGGAHAAERSIVIDLAAQTFVLYEGEQIIRSGPVSTGKEGHETPKGTFRVHSKNEHWMNRKGKPMLYAVWFIRERGIALHLGHATGVPESTACVRLDEMDAVIVFDSLRRGDAVVVR
jgi:lipoprotein-anchoring transpeptidase ErfK/SrfK